jgi:hypothetical protein
MKKMFLFVALAFSFSAKSQIVSADTSKKDFKNALGVDATTFVKQFFMAGNNSNSVPSFQTIISYRRFIKSNAIKLAAGGYIHSNSNTTSDTLKNMTETSGYCLRLGFEHYSYLGKRWMYYIGADAIFQRSRYESKNSASSTTMSESKSNVSDYGIAPVLGITFKINERLNIATEASIDFAYEKGVTEFSAYPSPLVYRRNQDRIITNINAFQLINLRIKF